ncbi:MAG: CPBP family intramembrane glutamic endopeptidase [Candidatus Kapaibacterium sp.]|jgi:membrane protease YdiL (CAAX protease family)
MENKIIKKYNRPIFFFGLSLLIPWVLWFTVAYISHLPEQSSSLTIIQALLAILGLLAPTFVAAYLFLSDKELLNDLKKRCISQKGFNPIYTFLAFTLIFISIVMAQLISLLFGHGIDQFYISGSPSFTSSLLSPWFILLFAPAVEELAWHSYGTDALRQRFNLFTTSIIFALYWAFWHLPLSFIDGYYHSNVVEEGLLYSLNYVFSLFVLIILMNWLYYKTNRNIFITIVFHCSANVSNEIFATHPDSKVIQTILLLIFTIVVLIKEKEMFFRKEL